MQTIDQAVLYFFNQTLANPSLDAFMWGATIWGLWIVPIVGLIYFFSSQREIGATLLLTLLASFLLTFLFYYLALRPRPLDVRLIMPTPNFPSFPSGHATLLFGGATAWVLAAKPNRLAIIIAYMTALVIAVSRLYLGHHYPTDVLAGAILGTTIGAATYGIVLDQATWIRRLRWLLWPQIAVAILVTMMAYLNVLPIAYLSFPYMDKILHFLLFGAITFWLQLWWPERKIGLGQLAIPLSILIPISVALIEEGFQALSPYRTASLLDLGADAAGMIFFYYIAQWLLRRDTQFVRAI